jgi:hypothetical protein
MTHPRGKAVAMRAVAGVGPNRGKHIEERLVVLAVLLGQIANGRRKIAPGRRRMRELCSVGMAKRQCLMLVLRSARDRRELEEIADRHDLHPAERRGHAFDVAADRVDQREAVRRQHRDLIDDEHLGPFDARGDTPVPGERGEVALGQCIAHLDPAPGMDGDAIDMRGGDARRGGMRSLAPHGQPRACSG